MCSRQVIFFQERPTSISHFFCVHHPYKFYCIFLMILEYTASALRLPLQPNNATSRDDGRSQDSNNCQNSSESLGRITDQTSLMNIYNNSMTSLPTLANHQESVPVASIENKDCAYLKLVMGFKRTLVIPDAFFLNEMPQCYCNDCLGAGGASVLKGMSKGFFCLTVQFSIKIFL